MLDTALLFGGHGYLEGASPSPGFFCAPGCEKII
jgi:hypothetical protein